LPAGLPDDLSRSSKYEPILDATDREGMSIPGIYLVSKSPLAFDALSCTLYFTLRYITLCYNAVT
jgi:hypothetical protein